jgi:hypothetical protein
MAFGRMTAGFFLTNQTFVEYLWLLFDPTGDFTSGRARSTLL